MYIYLYIPLTLVYIHCAHQKDRRLCVHEHCVHADYLLMMREGRQTEDKVYVFRLDDYVFTTREDYVFNLLISPRVATHCI